MPIFWRFGNLFNYEYIVLATPREQAELTSILADATTAWQEAAQDADQAIATNPDDATAEFDLSVADYYIGDYANSAHAFETAGSSVSEHGTAVRDRTD